MHPSEETLATYVDGALDATASERVETHLRSCPSCTQEVTLSRTARDALSELPDLSVPFGTAREAVKASRRQREASASAGRADPARATRTRAATYRLAGLATAAALVGIVGWAALHTRAPSVPANGAAAARVQPTGERPYDTDGNYTDDELQALAAAVAGQQPQHGNTNFEASAAPAAGGIPTSPPAPTAAGAAPPVKTVPAPLPPLGSHTTRLQAGSAAYTHGETCLRKGGAFARQGELVYILQARFQATPVYIGVLLEGKQKGPPYDRVVVWVVRRSDCQAIAFAQQLFSAG